ncbi:fumarylacetoacetate hydrolase [Allostella vacuolata]|nr:fumarylacetoacetate hydrolase [Stella vacuolata]
MKIALDAATTLPEDGTAGTLLARVWLPDAGPVPALLRGDDMIDLSRVSPTMATLLALPDMAARLAAAEGARIGSIADIVANSALDGRDPARPWLLAPCDLQAVKACGVTFASSMLERVIESEARGDAMAAEGIRRTLSAEIGSDLSKVKPGSDQAMKLKAALVERGLWSPYLEVGIGPDAEVFTKCPPMAAVGTGVEVGIHAVSEWNNPEPEIVVVVDPSGTIIGATLGNDVNLRDVEGRSALLLGKAKDNNASAAIGPFIRLFDATFGLDDVRAADVSLRVEGDDGFALDGKSSMRLISRDPTELVAHTIGPHHQYPDGFLLYTGTMFAPTKDRGGPGKGFTHHPGDIVTISSPRLGQLTNRVEKAHDVEPWTFGTSALMRSLAARQLL